MQNYQNLKKGERGALISIVAYFLLSVTKLTTSYVAGSLALRADGLNNATDVVAAVAVLIGLRIARKPPDDDHHYGHFRAEYIASLVASFIMVTVGIQVVIDAVNNLIQGNVSEPSQLAFWVAIVSGFFMYGIYIFNKRLARKINSSALRAASLDNRADSFISFAAGLGVLGTISGFYMLDAILSLAVGLLISYTAFTIFKDASHTLTDGFDLKTITTVKKAVLTDPDVYRIVDIKGRRLGNQTILDLVIDVDPNITVHEAHQITDRIEVMLEETLAIEFATIHVEPSPLFSLNQKENHPIDEH